MFVTVMIFVGASARRKAKRVPVTMKQAAAQTMRVAKPRGVRRPIEQWISFSFLRSQLMVERVLEECSPRRARRWILSFSGCAKQ